MTHACALAHYTDLAAQAAALMAARHAAVAASLTVYPFVLFASWIGPDGAVKSDIRVLEAHSAPRGDEIVPDDADRVLRAEVIPAERFATMPEHLREQYRNHYWTWLAWRWQRAGREIDCIALDQQIYGWLHPRGNWAVD